MDSRHRIYNGILSQSNGECVNIFLTFSTFDQFHSFVAFFRLPQFFPH